MAEHSSEQLRDYLDAWLMLQAEAAEDGQLGYGQLEYGALQTEDAREHLAQVEDCLHSLEIAWPDGGVRESDSAKASGSAEPGDGETGGDRRQVVSGMTAPGTNSDDVSSADFVGRFRLLECIGTGGMGSVFLAEDTVLDRQVALKIPRDRLLADASSIERFRREGTAAAQVRHANVVGVFESGTVDGIHYIASEFVDGPNLQQWLKTTGNHVSLKDAATCVEQLADGLHAVHQLGILHRDLKPSNVMLQPCAAASAPEGSLLQYVPRITDFGLARLSSTDRELTSTGEAIGTAAYTSPEQARGNNDLVGVGSDLFGLGVILYRLLTGKTPFGRDTLAATFQALESEAPVALRSLRAEVPWDLQAICLKCLEKKPENRYATAVELRDDLRRYLDGRPTQARPISRREQLIRWTQRSPQTAALIVVCALSLLLAVIGLTVYSGQLLSHQRELTDTLGRVDSERRRANELLQTANRLRATAEANESRAQQLVYDGDMRFAYDFRERDQLTQVTDRLQASLTSAAGRLDLAWHFLNAETRSRLRILARHDGPATEVCVVPGGDQVVSIGLDGVLRHIRFTTGETIGVYDLQSGPLHAVAVSPDGRTVAVGSQALDGQRSSLLLVDLATGAVLRDVSLSETTIESLAWSPDGKSLAVGPRYADVLLWDPSDEAVVRFAATRRNQNLAFFPDADHLLFATEDGLRSWNVSSATEWGHSFAGSNNRMTFAVTADGQVIAFRLPREPIIRIRSADAEWRETGRLEGLRAQSEAMTINSARSELAIALKDGYVQTYEMHLSDAHRSMPPGVGPICSELVHAGPCVSISYVDDHWTATAGEDGFVRGYNPTGTSLAPLTTVDCEAVDCVLSPDGRQICVVDTTAGLRIYTQDESLQTWSHAADLTDVLSESGMPHVPSSIWHQAFADDEGSDEHWIAQSSDGRRVAVATDSNRIAVFDVQARHHLVSFEVGEEDSDRYEWFKSLALSADGKFLASACSDRVLRVWSVDQGELICEREYTNSVEAVCFSPNSQQLVVGGRFEQMEVLSVPEAGLSWSAVAGGGTYCVGFLPEGDQFVTGHGDGTVRVWAIGGGSASAVYHGHASAVSAVTIGDDGQTAISIDERGDVRLWNLRGGQPVGRLFERRKSGLRFHRLLLPEDQSHCLAVVSSQRGQRQLRLIDLRP